MRFLKYLRHSLSLLIVLIFLLHASGALPLPLLPSLEHDAYDFRLGLTAPGDLDPRIVIVDIDEKSLAVEGQFPWDRDRLALLVNNLFDHYGISVLGFDVLFAERDEGPDLRLLDRLAEGPLGADPRFREAAKRIRPSLERDRLFAEALSGRPTVLGLYFKNEASPGDPFTTVGQLPEPAFSADRIPAPGIPFVTASGFGANLPELQANAQGAGFIDMPLVDDDGVMRRMLLLQAYEGALYPAFPLAVVQTALGSPPIEAFVAPGYDDAAINLGLEWLAVAGYRIPVNERGAALVPYRGPFPSFPYVSAVDVLNKTAPAEVLEGAIVLVGTTSAGLMDMRATPVQNVYPGVEIHANMIAGIFDDTIKQKPGYTRGMDFLTILALGVALSALLPRLSLVWVVAVAGLTLVALFGWNLFAWTRLNLGLPVVSQVALVVSLFVLHTTYGFFVENRGKRKLARLFGQYVPPELVEEMSEDDVDMALGGETREMTVLFCDIRGFTAIAESLDPTHLTQFTNVYFTEMTRIIHQHRGTIDKYMGDAIMAFWGAPLRDPNHARNATKAALDMIEALPAIQKRCEEQGWPPVRVGIGINSGPMNVGNMGSEFRMAYTVLGDAVNVASRLEHLTKRYHVPIIVSESTRALAPEYTYRELDLVRVAGKDTPVGIFEPLGPTEHVDHELQKELATYHTALYYYRNREWDEAKALMDTLMSDENVPVLYQLFYGRLVHYMNAPPPEDWDGVFTFRNK